MYSYFHQCSATPNGAFSSQTQYHYRVPPYGPDVLPLTQCLIATNNAAANRDYELFGRQPENWQRPDNAFLAPIYGASVVDRVLVASTYPPRQSHPSLTITLKITDVRHREPVMVHPVMPTPFAYTGAGSTQLISLEQCSSSASAGSHNNSQENAERAMPDSGVAALNQFQTMNTQTSSSSSSTSPPPPDNGATQQRRGPGRKMAPSSRIACTFPGCELAYATVQSRDRHIRTCHDPNFEPWYCPGLETGCCTTDGWYLRSDQLLAHVKREPGSACYRAAMDLGWHPCQRGSINNLKCYQPPYADVDVFLHPTFTSPLSASNPSSVPEYPSPVPSTTHI